MIDSRRLLSDMTHLRANLEADLRDRCDEDCKLDSFLRREHQEAVGSGRTALAYRALRDDYLTHGCRCGASASSFPVFQTLRDHP